MCCLYHGRLLCLLWFICALRRFTLSRVFFSSFWSAPASLRAHSFYNLGKLAYDRQDYANSVNYFKQSLKIDPKDDQARKNLRMAQKKLQQNQQNQDKNKNKDKDDQKKKQVKDKANGKM